jgi:putative PIN family toxin of toxin-antitoxin system
MSLRPRAVFDTSVLVSALIIGGSAPRRALLAALGIYDLCASTDTLAELATVLSRPKFNRYRPPAVREAFAALVAANSVLIAVDPAADQVVRGVCRDPQDAKFLSLALACAAEVVVTGDDDLLVLDGWQGIGIVSPTTFLQALADDDSFPGT